ncbi:thioredoxin-dependent thiol peroxidase [Helicobacter kayseriensis]|uniref:thioredoxin-dependent thiol peroxidase n=1 Tax=Helicobacter kayseriensis TaxID=2905877 RepID=UPI001E6050FC|nr:thioredoxin-dependent thiol peroxidase [Helicobacter kayseriensis]MCE3046929.1 thioredoxin-dependent thiol peroxidase [Helicobacter kayseriensis]MCE3048411.1 thioredoxin-dependent thiol peroxidase [Helicobacter kayseriensis]
MLKQGDQAPHFALPNQDGIEVALNDLLGRVLVLYFYPKDNTSGCSLEAQDFTALLEEFDLNGASIVGISPDSQKSHKRFIENKQLQIMLLSDQEKVVASKYGAFGEKKLYGKTYEGIIRSTFIIGEDGKILETFYNVKAKGHAQKVLERLKELKGKSGEEKRS